jgi:hypothetical protein
VTLCESVGVRDLATVTVDIDLGNDDGLFMARIFAAFAAKESGRKSARVRRKLLQNAEQGLPHGSVRPFGYEDDKITVRESEAVVVAQMVDRYLGGQSLRSLTVWLNDTGVAPAVASSWQTSAVRQILSSGRIAGLREHHGHQKLFVVGVAALRPLRQPPVFAGPANQSGQPGTPLRVPQRARPRGLRPVDRLVDLWVQRVMMEASHPGGRFQRSASRVAGPGKHPGPTGAGLCPG